MKISWFTILSFFLTQFNTFNRGKGAVTRGIFFLQRNADESVARKVAEYTSGHYATYTPMLLEVESKSRFPTTHNAVFLAT